MTENHAKSEVLRGPELRRRWAAAEKIAIMAERHESDVTVSLVARRHGGAEPGVQTQGIESEDVRDPIVASAESRFGQVNRFPRSTEWLNDDGSGYIAKETKGFARDFGFEPMTGAVDRESLLVQEITDPPDQQHFVVLVIPPVAAPLDGLQLRKLLLPIAEHVRFDRTEVTYLADGEIPLGGDGWQLGLNSTVVRHGSQVRPLPSAFGLRGK